MPQPIALVEVTLVEGREVDLEGWIMLNYIEQHRKFLETRHYIRYSGDLQGLDLHAKRLQEYRRKRGNNMCLVFYTDKAVNDAYIVPVTALDHIFIPDNYSAEVGENARVGRKRWKFKIEGDQLWIIRKAGLGLSAATLDLTPFHNNFELLGADCFAWAPFPSKEERVTLRPRQNRIQF